MTHHLFSRAPFSVRCAIHGLPDSGGYEGMHILSVVGEGHHPLSSPGRLPENTRSAALSLHENMRGKKDTLSGGVMKFYHGLPPENIA